MESEMNITKSVVGLNKQGRHSLLALFNYKRPCRKRSCSLSTCYTIIHS